MILDLRLPGMSGLELARQLRAAPATASLPILAASASALDREPEAALAAGCSDFVAKPFLAEDLLARVSGLLGGGGEAAGRSSPPRKTGPALDVTALRQLRAAALVGDVVQLRNEIGRLRAQGIAGPLIDEVERLARAFDVDAVAAITTEDNPAARTAR